MQSPRFICPSSICYVWNRQTTDLELFMRVGHDHRELKLKVVGQPNAIVPTSIRAVFLVSCASGNIMYMKHKHYNTLGIKMPNKAITRPKCRYQPHRQVPKSKGTKTWFRALPVKGGACRWCQLTQDFLLMSYSDPGLFAFSVLTLLVGWQEEQPAHKNWAMRCWHGYLSERTANDLHMVQLMPLPPHHLCFSKIHNGLRLSFWNRLTRIVPDKGL